jgi:RNA polymerase sigma factor for flagellar operon FliA
MSMTHNVLQPPAPTTPGPDPAGPRRPARALAAHPNPDAAADDLWTLYSRTQDPRVRDALIAQYLPMVGRIAKKLKRSLPRHVDEEELVSAGMFGLLFAVAAFKPGKRVMFETYCPKRIRGAMLDWLRSVDVISRQARQRAADLSAAAAALHARLARPPEDEEVRLHLGLDEKTFRRWLRDAQPARTLSLSQDRPHGAGGHDASPAASLEDRSDPQTLNRLERRELRDELLKGLTRRERLIIVLYYAEELNMKEIGQVLGVSEARVSQLHGDIVDRLRAMRAKRVDVIDQLAA